MFWLGKIWEKVFFFLVGFNLAFAMEVMNFMAVGYPTFPMEPPWLLVIWNLRLHLGNLKSVDLHLSGWENGCVISILYTVYTKYICFLDERWDASGCLYIQLRRVFHPLLLT